MAGFNYIEIINSFWDEAPYLEGYKGDHASLFFAVLDSVNRNKWREVEIEYDRLISKVRLGKKNYLECRRWLVENRFITLKEGRGDYAKAKFFVGSAVPGAVLGRTAKGMNAVPNEVPDRTADETGPETANETHLNKTIKHPYQPTNQSEDESDFSENYLSKKAEGIQKQTPVAAAPFLPEVWQKVYDGISSNDMCQVLAMRGIKANNLLDVYPEFPSVLNEFIEGERLKSQVPRWKDDNDMKSNFRDWLKTYLPKKRDQIDGKGNENDSAGYSKKQFGGAKYAGLKPPGVPPSTSKRFDKKL
ncbi:hypothetical protein BWI97_15855 [Siphonobacter sp. BAB-5405]|uniref:hypothetical protein n=1 Tax=Siphonobacter sp. BAB-5405 TaxID=1864825 RepID=UPI000C810229|nr:hypothetical protein [Siphonobacter sp. BAB-5405]PMD94870.1 hypothetical protein BWI97_15855 [Siphonobacter sp. BAB-5405]